ncbi:hypothetical protein KM043_008303 [Ampulex compressa]|nr:hypothetical protein KM043_008303 [Ampulex compressa]
MHVQPWLQVKPQIKARKGRPPLLLLEKIRVHGYRETVGTTCHPVLESGLGHPGSLPVFASYRIEPKVDTLPGNLNPNRIRSTRYRGHRIIRPGSYRLLDKTSRMRMGGP